MLWVDYISFNRSQSSWVSISVLQVQGESLLGSVMRVQPESRSVSRVHEGVGSVSGSHRESGSVWVGEEIGCFPSDRQVEVWWCSQPAGHLSSPECPAHRLNPFEVKTT